MDDEIIEYMNERDYARKCAYDDARYEEALRSVKNVATLMYGYLKEISKRTIIDMNVVIDEMLVPELDSLRGENV